MEGRLVVGVRFWEKNPEKISVIEKFIDEALKTDVYKIIIAINIDEDKTDSVKKIKAKYNEKRVKVFGVTPWGRFITPCNVLMLEAIQAGATHLVTASAEVILNQLIIDELMHHMDDMTLMAGAALEGHDLQNGLIKNANGIQFPWGTCAIWNLRYLGVTGISLIGDAPFSPINAGVEEMVSLTILQNLYPETFIKLVEIDGIKWNTNFQGERLKKHLKKMQSKKERPESQFQWAGLTIRPIVLHIRKR